MARRAARVSAVSGLAAALIAHAVSAAAAAAAERICEAPITGGPAMATSEQDARMAALASWRMKTLKSHGKRHADWGIAVEKVTRCRARDEGGFECTTTARPCAVRGADEELGI